MNDVLVSHKPPVVTQPESVTTVPSPVQSTSVVMPVVPAPAEPVMLAPAPAPRAAQVGDTFAQVDVQHSSSRPSLFARHKFTFAGVVSLLLIVGCSVAAANFLHGGRHVAAQVEQTNPIVTPVTIAPTPTVPDLPSDATAGTTPKSF